MGQEIPGKLVKLIYIGRRLNGTHLEHAFLDRKNSKKPMFWRGRKGLSIGQTYASYLTKDSHVMAKYPESLGSAKADNMIEDWQHLDQVAWDKFYHIKATKKAEVGIKAMANELPTFKKLVKKMTYNETRLFLDHLVTELKLKGK